MRRLNKSSIFFKLFTDRDEIFLRDIYAAGNRNTYSTEKNIVWLQNKLVSWKKRGIVAPVYTTTGFRRRLIGIKLTDRGRTLLGRPTEKEEQGKITIEIIEKILEQKRKEHPDFEITFTIRSKQGNLSLQLD